MGNNYNQCVKAIHTAYGEKKALVFLYKLVGETQKLEQTMQQVIALAREFRTWLQHPAKTTVKP